jgi:TldD protein
LLIIEREMAREKEAFSNAAVPPYFLDYRVNDVELGVVGASFGSLTLSSIDHTRMLNTHVRVGDYQVDNTHPMENAGPDFNMGRGYSADFIPIDDNPDAVSFQLWSATQSQYKAALEQYQSVKSLLPTPTTQNSTPDFSKELPEVHFEPPMTALTKSFNKKEWEDRVRNLSRIFTGTKDIVNAEVTLQILQERKYYVSSEGASVVQNFRYAYLNIQASIRANDGEIVPLHRSYYNPTPGELPADGVIEKDIQAMITVLGKLKTAPLADPYTGPALLEAPVAGVFFHEIFGHRVEGHRLRNEEDGQTFKAKVNQRILPESINVICDPTMKKFDGRDLNGAYSYDDEGVKSRKVSIVEKGMLRNFLMSRSPLDNFRTSNGHGRATAGVSPVSRQSNLIVSATKTKTDGELRQMLIKECQRQKKEYGYLFRDVVGGFTLTGRFTPNAFNIFPTEVYRIYVDGRADELVRGVDLIGTPLAMFAEIAAAGKTAGIFTGFCGAESGDVPVSAVSPALFVRRIETQKKPRSKIETTLLPAPALKN